MNPHELLTHIHGCLLRMEPAELIESESVTSDLFDQFEKLPPAEAARLLPELSETRVLAESALLLLGLLPGSVGAEPAGYTALGTPAGRSSHLLLRA